jgi:hypothetical protein
MPHDPIGGYFGHEPVSVTRALSPAELKGERDGVGEILGIGGSEPFIVGHGQTIA